MSITTHKSGCPGNCILEPRIGKIKMLKSPRFDVNPKQSTESSVV